MDWIGSVVEIARAHHKQTGRALPLPLVPPALRARGFDLFQILQGRKLKAALESEGAGLLSLIQNPKAPLAWSVLPADLLDEKEIAGLFPNTSFPEDQRQGDRYFPAFWAAFVKPLPEGSRRFLILNEKLVRFDDFENGAAPPNAVEVLRDDIVELASEADRPDHESVLRNVREWASRNEIDLSRFVIKAGEDVRKRSGDFWFERLMQLPNSDLSRIMIPMDVLKKVL